MSSVTEDTYVKRMIEHLQVLDKPDNDDEEELEKKEDAFEGLQEIVDNIDNANGLYTMHNDDDQTSTFNFVAPQHEEWVR